VVKLVHEGSVAAGIRRVEALTGMAGLNYLNTQAARLHAVAERLKTDPEQVLERLDRTLEHAGSLQAQLNQQAAHLAQEEIKKILESDAVKDANGYKLVVFRHDNASVDELRKLTVSVRDKLGSGVVIVGSANDGKGNLLAASSRDLVQRGASSNTFIAAGAKILGGGGGGKPDLAVAGGPHGAELDRALKAAEDEARRILENLG
jgi:alanyl-tRNA synthetase